MKQGAFVQRSIVENILLAQEVMHSLKNVAPIKELVIFKVDMKKDHNRFHWPFLFTLLNQFGFHPRFVA